MDIDGIELVRSTICSLDGGFNGLNLGRQLSIQEQVDGSIRYALLDSEEVEQVFTITITAGE